MNIRVAILRDDQPESSANWELACRKKNYEFITINMHRADWLEEIRNFNPHFCVSRPPGEIQQSKKIFDEKLYFLVSMNFCPVYPGFPETFIYENKATLAWFLKINRLPHPYTFVSADRKEALEFIENTRYPLVAKTLIGAAGSGVKILDSKRDARNYVSNAFKKGIRRRYGPNRKTGNPRSWLVKAIKSPSYFFKKIKEYRLRDEDVQKGVVLLQEYIPHHYEWRIVKIGNSFFGYKKLKIGDKASGSKQFDYGEVPEFILDFAKELCEKFNFNFMAIDLFVNNDSLYINELQTIFGHKSEYICKVNNTPGRYRFLNNKWTFEAGMFNTNESYDLRLETAVDLYKSMTNTLSPIDL